MITPALPSNLANFVAPFSPVGKLAVGEENPEARNTPFKPVEELSQSARQENRASSSEQAALAEERVEFPEQRNSEDEDASERRKKRQTEVRRQRQEDDLQTIRELSQRDRDVRAHEQAHSAVGGALAGAPVYRYQRGPDGVSYAISGEVSIRSGAVAGDPEATLRAARRVQSAALAPAEPSPQDRRVAAEAAQLEQQAIQEIALRAAEQRQLQTQQLDAKREQRAQQLKEEQDRLAENRERQAEIETQDARRRAEYTQSSIDINRRLIDIGAIESPSPIGGLLNLSA